MNPTSALIVLIFISGAFAGGRNRGRGGDGIRGGGGSFGGEGYEDYKNQTCTENSITCSDDGSETCPDDSMKPALTLAEQEEWQKCFCCVDRKEMKEKDKQARCDVAGIDCNPANRALGGFMQNGGRGGGGGRGGESKIGPFQTEEEIAESAQRYCCGD